MTPIFPEQPFYGVLRKMTSMERNNSTGSVLRVAARLGPSTGVLGPHGIRAAPLAALALALVLAMVLAGLALWPAPADAEEPAGPLWSADMTVVEYTSVSIGAASADLFSNVGGSGNLRIRSLWSHVPDRDLRLAFEEGLPDAANYTLQVGGLSLEFPAGSSGASSFKWTDVDVDWEDGQLIRVSIVLTSEIAAPQANIPATGIPTVSGTAQVGEKLAADTSGIADEDGLDGVSYHYQWLRADAGTDGGADDVTGVDTDIADATDSTYTLTDDDQGKTARLKVSFIDDEGNSETLTSAATAEVSKRPQFLVSNLGAGVGGAGGIQRTLNAARSGFAQAFTTGARTGGYAPDSVGIQVSHFFDESTVGDHLRVTINGAASEGGPGDAHCTLANPSSFPVPGVIAFEAPAGAGSCPQLAAETTYFVVIEWVNPSETGSFALIPQTYPTEESAATGEDPGGAEGWSIADNSYYLTAGSAARTWSAYAETASFKIQVKEAAVTAARANSPATGAPTISGTPQVGEILTADTPAIADEDGLENVSYSYQWIRSDNGPDTDIAGATDSSYTLVLADLGKTIKVKVSFTDDAENEETRTSVSTEAVAAAPNTPATGAPTISGKAQVGERLTASTSAIADADGMTKANFIYSWNAGERHIQGATGISYTLTQDQEGLTMQVLVAFLDDNGNSEVLASEASGPVAAKAPNSPATGVPTISGTAQVGETLTADTPAIADEDGLGNVSYSYQWLAGGADISGATGSSYLLTSGEEGQTIQVKVSFTDDADNAETLTSAATVAVAAAAQANNPATGLPTISGTPQVGQTLTADTSDISDQDGLTGVSYSYQWTAGGRDIGGATGSSYLLTSGEEGQTIQVRVTFTDDADYAETLTSAATEAVAAAAQANSPATGVPTISGTPQVSQTLTASTSDIADQDGLTNVSYRYQWLAGGRDIGGATGSGYLLTSGEEGQTIQVRVTFTDDADYAETLTSEATEAVAAAAQANSPATGVPTISGTPQVGQTLTASTSDIADQDGLTNVSYRYQWIAGGSDIDGATGSGYLLTSGEQGQTIQVRVTFTDDADYAETLTSAATEAVAAAALANNPATGAPTISGTPQVGETLTADTSAIADQDGLTNVSYSYQWLAGGSDIDGATGSSYALTAGEQGKTIAVQVTFTDDADNAETLTSAATEAVAAAPVPLTVSVTAAAPATHDGSSEFTFDIEFSEEVGLSFRALKSHAFNVTGGSVERAQRTDKPSNISWRITVKPTATGDVTGDVTVQLPATTDCGAQGAICTGDGRKLSNSLSFTVSGPGS